MSVLRKLTRKTKSQNRIRYNKTALRLEPLEQRLLLTSQYTLTDLGHFGGDYAVAMGINDQGQVAGYSADSDMIISAFLWDDGSMTAIKADSSWGDQSQTYGCDINESGYVAGQVDRYTKTDLAFYDDGTNTWNIHTLNSAYSSKALGINDGGIYSTIVGYYADTSDTRYPFSWSVTTGMVSLGSSPGQADDVNNANRIVGRKLTATSFGNYYHAGYWQNSAWTDIDSSNIFGSAAVGVNNNGDIVGWQHTGQGNDWHAFVWTSSDGLQTLGTLLGDDDGDSSDARAINDTGQIVGTSDIDYWDDTSYPYRAFVYEDGEMTNLEDVTTNLGSWKLLVAEDINNSGQIVGWGRLNNRYRAFLLTPSSEPDNEAPTAVMVADDVTTGGDTTYTFEVTFSDNEAVDVSTIDNADIRITGPNVFDETASLVSVDTNTDGSPRTALYQIDAPGGEWDADDNGEYLIEILPGQVGDTGGNFVIAGQLDTFTVNITPPLPDEQIGPMILSHSPTTAPSGGFGTIDVTFDKPINTGTFTAADVSLLDPDSNPVTISSVSSTGGNTYRISFASQTDPGDYLLRVGPNINDTNGNPMNQDQDEINGEPGDYYSAQIRLNPDALTITSHTPFGTASGTVDEITVTFSDAINTGTFTADDVTLTGPNGTIPVTNVLLDSGNTWRILFADQSDAGTYSFTVGPNINNTFGIAMNQDGDNTPGETSQDAYTAQFVIAASTLKIASHSPTTRQEAGLDYADVIFSEAINESTFTKSDVTITGPTGAVTVSGVEKITATKYRITFPLQTAYGNVTITIGPDIATADGAIMNQDADDTAGEDPDDTYTAVIPVGQQPQLEGLVFRYVGCEIADYVITVRAGQAMGGEPFRVLIQNTDSDWTNVSVSYYLSTDSNVTTGDSGYPLTWGSVRLEAGGYYETAPTASADSSKFYAPETPGTYYLKAKANSYWSPLITLKVVAPANDGDKTAYDSVNPEIKVSALNPNKTGFMKNEPYQVQMLLTNTGEIDYIPDMINYEYNIGTPSYNVHDVATIYQFRRTYSWSLGQDFDAPYIPAGQSVTAANTASVFWSADSVDIKYISNVYSNVDSPYYNDTYSQVITVTHSGEWTANAKPDLNIGMNLSAGSQALPGDVIPFTLTVTNSGNNYSWGGNIALYRSNDSEFDTGYSSEDAALINKYNDCFEIPYLLPNQSVTFEGELVMPAESGTYYFSAFADAGSNISESNENNNQSQVFSIKVGNAQATADVTWPPVGDFVDIADLDEKDYIEVLFSHADDSTINGDEIALAGAGADNLSIGSMTKVADGKYRYTVKGDYSAGDVDVIIKAGTFKNNSSESNAAETESFYAVPDLNPFVLTYDKDNLSWDAAKQQFSYTGEASLAMKNGTAVDPLVTIEGTFNYDDLKIHFENVTLTSDIGDINMPLVKGTFDMNLKEKGWSTIEKLPSEILIGGALLSIDSVVFNTPKDKPTQIEIQGAIKLSPDIADVSITVGGPHKIVIAPEGISLTGGELSFPDKKFKLLNTINVESSGVSVEYLAADPNAKPTPLPDRLRVRGTFVFPDWWKAKADLSKNTVDASKDNYIEISENGVDVKGAFSFEEIDWGLWQVKELKITVDTKQKLWQGDLTLKTPLSSVAIVGGAGIVDGEFNYVALGVDDLNIMIGTSPVFLQKIVGNVNHISDKDKDPISIGGQLGFTAGPTVEIWFPEQLGGYQKASLAKLELEGEVNVQKAKGYGKLTTIGNLLTGEVTAEIDYSKVTSDPNAAWSSVLVTAKGEVKALWDLFVGQASIAMDCRTETKMAASGSGKVSIPKYVPFWGGAEIASGEMIAKFNDDNNYKNDYLAGWGSVVVRKFGKAYKFTVGAQIDLEGNTTWLGGRQAAELKLSYSDFEQSITKPQSTATASLSAKSIPSSLSLMADDLDDIVASSFNVTEGTPFALLAAQWENPADDAELIVIAPDGTVYYEDDIRSSSFMAIIDDEYLDDNQNDSDLNLSKLPDNTKAVLIDEPDAGEWIIRVVSDTTDIGATTYNGVLNTPAPEVAINSVSADGNELTINYTATDADGDGTVSFYIDTDDEGLDGILISTELPADGSGTFTFEAQDIPGGDYYVYAVAHDTVNAPVSVYYANSVTIEEIASEDVQAGDGLAKSVIYTDPDGTIVTVKVAKGQATLSFTGDNLDILESKKGIEILGDNVLLKNIDLFDSSDATSITISAKGGSVDGAELGGITGGNLGKLNARGIDLVGDIDLDGSLGSMMLDDIADNVSIVSAQAYTKGFSIKADQIGDNVEFDLAGLIKSFQANQYADGSIKADSISKITTKLGDFAPSVEANTGDILQISTTGNIEGDIDAAGFIKKITSKSGSLLGKMTAAGGNIDGIQCAGDIIGDIYAAGSIKKISTKSGALIANVRADENIDGIQVAGDISGNISADGFIKKVMTKSGDITGTLRAGLDIAALQAVNLEDAIISSGRDIKKVSLKGDITGSFILGGYDIGADTLFGGGDTMNSGNIISVSAKGTFADSYIAAGVLPSTSLTSFLADAGMPSGSRTGSIGKTSFGGIDFDTQTDFGLYAADSIAAVKYGKEKTDTSIDHFLMQIL